jgi:polyferredoxin
VKPVLNPLIAIKLLHTVIWACFAGCIIAIPFLAWARRFEGALLLIGIVLIEVLVLAVNAWRCPLTAVAGRYTGDRRDNFDIYLPVWLARHNKSIFGTLFVAGVAWTAALRLGWVG